MKKIFFILLFCICFNAHFNAHAGFRALPSTYNELIDYIIPSPDQKKSGSCLYMASTGAVEIAVNKFYNLKNPEIDGPYDLAEVYALRGDLVVSSKSWYENPTLVFNSGSVLSRDFPYNPETFWNDYPPTNHLIDLPPIDTLTLFKSVGIQEHSRLSFGVLNENHILQIKNYLVQYRSPLVVIYRDAGFEPQYGHWDTWHTVVIVGYDDNSTEPPLPATSFTSPLSEDESADALRCPTVYRTFSGFGEEDAAKLRTVIKSGGGCREKGVFLIRDSEEPETPENPRVPKYTSRSYDWLKYMGNHGFVVYVKK
ncbi:MAG: hypothetical protein HQK49_13525 [Oligoflexia bacterium]|nr:hypothetical protein [Oligoflexia bacterium]